MDQRVQIQGHDRFRSKSLLQAEKLKYFKVLFPSEERTKQKIDKWIATVMEMLNQSVMVKRVAGLPVNQ